MTDRVAQVLAARTGVVVAAAGCGKTHLLASVVAATVSPRPQLVLTHTHAGVDAIRRKISLIGGCGRADVETIAGWALRWTTAYPTLSGVSADPHKSNDWRPIYAGASRLVAKQAIASVLRASYSGVLVDEYQDCSIEQHCLVTALATALPCRVFGDPLQAIFDFDKTTRLVDWESEVYPTFGLLTGAAVPYRWARTNPRLGRWLLHIRAALTAGASISLADAPIEHVRPQPDLLRQINALSRPTLRRGGTVTVIRNMKAQCEHSASRLGAPWRCIDAVDDGDAIKAVVSIAASAGADRAHAIVELTTKVASGATGARAWVDTIRKGGRSRIRKDLEAYEALQVAATEPGIEHVAPALSALLGLPDVRVHRWQLVRDVRAALDVLTRDGGSGEDAIWAARNSTRHRGRPVGRASVGRTLLVKGLEFDHVVLLDADKMNARNLYVALTRGASRLTVVSETSVLVPKGR